MRQVLVDVCFRLLDGTILGQQWVMLLQVVTAQHSFVSFFFWRRICDDAAVWVCLDVKSVCWSKVVLEGLWRDTGYRRACVHGLTCDSGF